MAVAMLSGFEMNNNSDGGLWTVSGSAGVQNTYKRTGDYAGYIYPAAGTGYYEWVANSGTYGYDYAIRF